MKYEITKKDERIIERKIIKHYINTEELEREIRERKYMESLRKIYGPLSNVSLNIDKFQKISSIQVISISISGRFMNE